jgi:AcrR family transcriptional regulator
MPGRDAKQKGSSSSPETGKLVWTRPVKQRRVPRTREEIVAAAVTLADAEGLDAVSIRRIAAQLKTRPMSVYSFAAIQSKEDLFDLMIDTACAEMLLTEGLPKSWRAALRATAVRTRAVLMRHPWWIDLLGRRVLIGPNATRYREQTLASVAELHAGRGLKMAVVTAVETYVVGQAAFAVDRRCLSHKSDRTYKQWRKAVETYQHALLGTGEFPHLARAGSAELTSPEDVEKVFTLGLDWLLSGIAASLQGRQPSERIDQ